ncbi:Hsp70 family protein [Teichococcus vastitatis]|uniref:Hsp70 family protein n=1 Tax=Teichococcus vastitatis TaxID=2307076 RepID=A0ABS9W4V7_9PROT|nr:Hsp70 family protein [Pseudoroseomonas vastitatis]MCI0754327.1 Hsp70 family protein [Pseudoroseomonas vastitatis]
MTAIIGLDFGTTNSVISLLDENGQASTARFDVGAGALDVFRSVLCFWAETGRGNALRHEAGPAAIEAYLEDPLASRLIMSMKSHLATASFTETRIFGRAYTLEGLIALFLRALLGAAGEPAPDALMVVGRPVRFAGETADDVLAERRLRAAFVQAGRDSLHLALEPEAAGTRFAATLDGPATVLVGDFGGGTSDFSILRFDPAENGVTALGHAGVGIAGDALDYRIIDKVVSPALGKGDTYRVMNTDLPVPPAFFSNFAHWHRLSMMRGPKTLREIEEVARLTGNPAKLRHLITLIEDEAGYGLYRAVSGAKAALSGADSTRLVFEHEGFHVDAAVTRAEFESWIAPEIARMAQAIDAALADAGLAAEAVDRVFLTGGTSLVPAVRRLFDQRFGAERVAGGGEFVSVAEGLALIGQRIERRTALQ